MTGARHRDCICERVIPPTMRGCLVTHWAMSSWLLSPLLSPRGDTKNSANAGWGCGDYIILASVPPCIRDREKGS